MSEDITVVMSGYKRPFTTAEQYESIKNQTIKDVDILFWINFPPDSSSGFPLDIVNNCKTILTQQNFGVWGRFVQALQLETEYVCIIDDDTIPGDMWLENCLETMKTHEGVLTTRGVEVYKERKEQYPIAGSYQAFGWCNPNETVKRVDIGCHSWFFRKNWLRAFFADMPNKLPKNYGEDIHLSASIKRHLGYNTYVPPHPKNNKRMWGSHPDKATEYGHINAISLDAINNKGMNIYWNHALNNLKYKILQEE